ncbi:MAG: AAA family ATPase [Planctomycetes bacterium]|nr:AAA family ATPase [Planctomycetota bacterium]
MYESYWNLETKPFESTSDPRFYFPSEAHQGALLKLRYAVENHRCAALLSGAAGVGKTLLIHALSQQLIEVFSPLVHIGFSQMPSQELTAYIADKLTGERSGHSVSIHESVQRIEQALSENTSAGRHAVIVVDEAQLLRDSQTLETLRLLMNFGEKLKSFATILLVGQPSLLPALDRMPELDGRLAVKCLLRPFTQEETIDYVKHRLTAAGTSQPIFDESALPAIHYFSHGIARQINRLCDLALLIGFAEERKTVEAAQIEGVADELATVVPE